MRDSCGARKIFCLGAAKFFDRSAFYALAFSSAGGARRKTANSATPAYLEVIVNSEEVLLITTNDILL